MAWMTEDLLFESQYNREVSILQSTQTGYDVHRESFLMCTQGSILKDKKAKYFQAQE